MNVPVGDADGMSPIAAVLVHAVRHVTERDWLHGECSFDLRSGQHRIRVWPGRYPTTVEDYREGWKELDQ